MNMNIHKRTLIILLCMLCTLLVQAQSKHVIQRGETIESLAKEYGVTPSDIQNLNPLVSIYCTGMEIVLPPKPQPVAARSSETSHSTRITHGGSRFLRGFGNFLGFTLQAAAYAGAAFFGGGYPQYSPSGYYPSTNYSSDWGTGFAGGMQYSNDPILNSTIGMAMTEQRLMNAGVTINPNISYQQGGSTGVGTNEALKQANRDYYAEHWGNKDCHLCHGTGTCQTCNGKGTHLVNGQTSTCTNCWLENGSRTGKCSICQGKGTVYGTLY